MSAAVIAEGRAVLGIELGSTRIKACLIDPADSTVLAVGAHEWQNELVDGYWSYALEAVHAGLQAAYAAMLENHKALGESESLRTAFCAEHGVGEKMLARWLADGSEVFSRERVKQTKQRYYSKAEYENLRRIAREFYDQHNGRVDKSALAHELQADRSTVTMWVNSFDLEVESGQ